MRTIDVRHKGPDSFFYRAHCAFQELIMPGGHPSLVLETGTVGRMPIA